MSDETKVIEEVAKTTGKVIDAGRELGGFFSKYVGGSIEQAMGIFEDKFKYLRWERQIRLIERANHFLAEKGLLQPSRKLLLHSFSERRPFSLKASAPATSALPMV